MLLFSVSKVFKGNAQFIFLFNPQKSLVNVCFMKILTLIRLGFLKVVFLLGGGGQFDPMCLIIILKVTKNQGFHLSLEDTLFEKPQGRRGQNDAPNRFRVKKHCHTKK